MQMPGWKPITLIVDVLVPEEGIALRAAPGVDGDLGVLHLEVSTRAVEFTSVVHL